MVKIIFLDVDGVLNHELFYIARYNRSRFTFGHWWWKIERWVKWIFNGFEHKAVSLKPDKNFEKKWKEFQYRFGRFKEETDIVKLRWLDEICQKTKAKIVISSSHRSTFSIEEWNKVFTWMELDSIDVVGVTGWDMEKQIRGYEIKKYLDERKGEIADYVILDDDHDVLPEQFNNFFPTDPYCGITPEIYRRIIQHFNHGSKYLCGVSLNDNHL